MAANQAAETRRSRSIKLFSTQSQELLSAIRKKYGFDDEFDLNLAFVGTWYDWVKFWSAHDPKTPDQRRKFLDEVDDSVIRLLKAFKTAGDDDYAAILDSEYGPRYGLSKGETVLTNFDLVELHRLLTKLTQVTSSARKVLPGRGRRPNNYLAGTILRLKRFYERGTGKRATLSKLLGTYRGQFYFFVRDAMVLLDNRQYPNASLGRAIEKVLAEVRSSKQRRPPPIP